MNLETTVLETTSREDIAHRIRACDRKTLRQMGECTGNRQAYEKRMRKRERLGRALSVAERVR